MTITLIKFKIKDFEIELTPAEIAKLKEEVDNLFYATTGRETKKWLVRVENTNTTLSEEKK